LEVIRCPDSQDHKHVVALWSQATWSTAIQCWELPSGGQKEFKDLIQSRWI